MAHCALITACLVISVLRIVSAFNLYPPFNAQDLAESFGITLDCLNALNATVDCDQTLFQMAGSVDNYYWAEDDISTLCTDDCIYSTAVWDAAVASQCWNQTLVVNGKLVEANSITGRALNGVDIACLYSSKDDESCLIASQLWVGSDVVQPNCDNNSTDPSCIDPTNVDPANERMANLYNDDTLCSDCFVQMLYTRVTSPYLADVDYSDYLVDQLQDIGDVCSTSIPPITVRAIPTYATAASATSIVFGNATSTSSVTSTPTCLGQTIIPGYQSGCNALSTKYNVTTGDLQTLSGSDICSFNVALCLPSPCALQQVSINSSCDSIVGSISSAAINVTTFQLLIWNPNIKGLCDSLTPAQYICVSAPGGTYQLAPPPLGDNATAGNQQRGGPGGASPANITVTSLSMTTTSTTSSQSITIPTTSVTTSVTTSAAPGPTQSGIVATCTNYAMASKGDTCIQFAQDQNITTTELYTWNPVLGADGVNCASQFWSGEYYCVGSSTPTTTTSASALSSTSVTSPGPTQSGIVTTCNKFAVAQSGDTCGVFAQRNGITTTQLYTWNTVLGTDGTNCATSLWASEYYCVGVSA